MFITFEGIDGCGKTTQLGLLREALENRGLKVLTTREPGGTGLAESIRHTLLHAGGEVTPGGELLLFGAARAQHVTEIIRPALERGEWVLSDRFGDSSVAYQGGGLGLDPQFIRSMNAFATGGLVPDLTIYLDMEPQAAYERRQHGGQDKIEARGLGFQDRVLAAYREIAEQEPERVLRIDGGQPVEAVQALIWDRVFRLL